MIERFLIVGSGSIGKRHGSIMRKVFPNSKIILLRHKKCDKLSQKNIDYCVTKLNDAIKLTSAIIFTFLTGFIITLNESDLK